MSELILIYDRNKQNLRRKSKSTVSLKTGRFDNTDSAIIIRSVSKAVQN